MRCVCNRHNGKGDVMAVAIGILFCTVGVLWWGLRREQRLHNETAAILHGYWGADRECVEKLQGQLEHARHEIRECEELEEWHKLKRDALQAEVEVLTHKLALERARTEAAFAREWEQWGERDRLSEQRTQLLSGLFNIEECYWRRWDELRDARRELNNLKADHSETYRTIFRATLDQKDRADKAEADLREANELCEWLHDERKRLQAEIEAMQATANDLDASEAAEQRQEAV